MSPCADRRHSAAEGLYTFCDWRVVVADTNIGTDDRSQFDLFEAMPGGVAGVRRAVDELHAAGVKVTLAFLFESSRLISCYCTGTGPYSVQSVGCWHSTLWTGNGNMWWQRQLDR